MKLTEQDKKKIIELIQAGKPLPVIYKAKLFDSGETEFIEATKDYKLVYKGKARKEDIIAQTPAAPFQLIRTFNSDNPFEDDWRNMLIFGDNLMALKTLYDDQRGQNIYKTKNRIKLICIDPPFATKQDFMKDREKAYRDKIIGAQFIEFLRKRLILLREILADDGSIYIHLDWKKGHYIKAIMDEVFGEHNFINEIIWPYDTAGKGTSNFHRKHDVLFFYSKNKELYSINVKEVAIQRKIGTAHLKHGVDENGREYYEDFSPRKSGKKYRWYIDEGVLPSDVWSDIGYLNPSAQERLLYKYPTQKPEALLERCIKSSTTKDSDDIVLDTFSGSGTTLAVAEKIGRRWIGMDCGKLSIYTVQKRMLHLTTQIGSRKNDERRAHEKVTDFEEHYKSNSVETKDAVPIDQAAREIKLFLKDKDAGIAKQWSLVKIKDLLVSQLENSGYDSSFLSRENLVKAKQAFGPMLRELGKETPRMKMKPDALHEVKIEGMTPQFFSESSIKENGYLFYTEESPKTLPKEQVTILYAFLKDKENYQEIKEMRARYGGSESEIRFLVENLHEVPIHKFKTPLNFIFASYEPEYRFVQSLFNNIELFDSILKSPDRGFYSFPYSYKPDEKGSSHVKRENFNPDFFLKLKGMNEILVVEIKQDGDTNQKNKAKYRDGKSHFDSLNEKLKENGIDWKYNFYFLSPDDRTDFFQAIRDNRYKNWKSSLMQDM